MRQVGFRFSWTVFGFSDATQERALCCSWQGWAGVSNARARSGVRWGLFVQASISSAGFLSGIYMVGAPECDSGSAMKSYVI